MLISNFFPPPNYPENFLYNENYAVFKCEIFRWPKFLISLPIFLTFQHTCTLADNVVSAVPVVASSFNWKHTNSFPQGLIYVIVDCTNSYFFCCGSNQKMKQQREQHSRHCLPVCRCARMSKMLVGINVSKSQNYFYFDSILCSCF